MCFSPYLVLLLTDFFSFFFPPLFVSCSFIIGSLSVLPLLLRHLSSHPSPPCFSIEILHPPPQFQCYLHVHCSSLLISFIFWIFPVLQSALLFSYHFLALHLVILPGSSTELLPLPHTPHFLSCFSVYYRIFWFLLIFSLFWSANLLPLSVCPCSLLHSCDLGYLCSAHGCTIQ